MYYHICSPKIPLCYCCVLFTMWKNKKFTLNWKKFRENSITNYNTRRSYKNVPVWKENQFLFQLDSLFFFARINFPLFFSLHFRSCRRRSSRWRLGRRPTSSEAIAMKPTTRHLYNDVTVIGPCRSATANTVFQI